MSATTADFLDRWSTAGAGRWLASLLLVVALHVGAALLFVFHQVQIAVPAPRDEPVLMDLAPAAQPSLAAHPSLVAPVPAATGSNSAEATNQQGQIQVPITPAPSLPAAPQPKLEVAQLPAPPQTSAPEPPKTEPVDTPPAVTQPTETQPAPVLPEASSIDTDIPRILVPPPPMVVAEASPRAAAPTQVTPKPASQAPAGLDVLPQPNAREDPLSAWQRVVVAKLYSLKTWPHDALVNKETGSVDVTFLVDRQGHIVYFKISHKSPYESLNHAVRTLMRKANPLPPPPPPAIDLGQPLQFTVTINFS